MLYHLYKKQRDSQEKADIEIKEFSPKPWKLFIDKEQKTAKAFAVRVWFWLISCGKYKIFYCTSPEGELMHLSFVVPNCFKFPFLSKNEWEIGPCVTYSKFRGRGIYPKVLQYITEQKADTNFFMFVAEDNRASIKGIEKAGFERVGILKKTKILKIYKEKK